MARSQIAKALEEVPNYRGFLSVDALAEAARTTARAFSGSVGVRRIGTSRLGEPIEALVVGSGRQAALVFGGVHPNEPVGGLTAIYLATVLAGGPLPREWDTTWYIVPCIDPDGTRLNQEWFDGPYTRSHYGRNFYRPASDEQVEWTFPLSYKDAYFDRVLPETFALMRVIDTVKPFLMVSLHNGELGGAYFYLSRELPELYPSLKRLPEEFGLPLDLGEPEVPYAHKLDSGIFESLSSEDAYDYAQRTTGEPWASSVGDSSASYAAKYGTLTLVSEVPYWTDARSQNLSLTSWSYADALREHAAGLGELTDELDAALEAMPMGSVAESPFLRAMRHFTPLFHAQLDRDRYRAELLASRRQATVAEVHSFQDNVHCFKMRYGGMMLRAMAVQIEVGGGTPDVRRGFSRLTAAFEAWASAADAATPSESAPIRSLVGTQVGAILEAADILVGSG